jgi:sulfur-oxidizing protein SoxY
MSINRRIFLQKTGAIAGSGLLLGSNVQAEWEKSLFSNNSVNESFRHLFKTTSIEESAQIKLKAPTIAENGAVVPLTVTSHLENTEQIYIFVEKNRVPLVAIFTLMPLLEGVVSARIKMSKTSDVIVVVKAQSNLYRMQKTVKVTIGGCGG